MNMNTYHTGTAVGRGRCQERKISKYLPKFGHQTSHGSTPVITLMTHMSPFLSVLLRACVCTRVQAGEYMLALLFGCACSCMHL